MLQIFRHSVVAVILVTMSVMRMHMFMLVMVMRVAFVLVQENVVGLMICYSLQ